MRREIIEKKSTQQRPSVRLEPSDISFHGQFFYKQPSEISHATPTKVLKNFIY